MAISARQQRKNSIQILYKYYLLDKDILKIKQEVLNEDQFENSDSENSDRVLEELDFIKEGELIIESLLRDWTWNRIPNIIKAILLNAVYEIKVLKISKAIVINESIELSISYLPSFYEKKNFINAILDKID